MFEKGWNNQDRKRKSRFNSAIRIKTKMLSSTRILTFLLSSLLVAAQDDRCPRPEAIAPCQCRTRGPTIQGENPSLNNQSCNRRPLCSTFTFENVSSFIYQKKIKKNIFFFFNIREKNSQELLIIGLQLFMYWPGCSNGLETKIPYHPKPLNAGLGI